VLHGMRHVLTLLMESLFSASNRASRPGNSVSMSPIRLSVNLTVLVKLRRLLIRNRSADSWSVLGDAVKDSAYVRAATHTQNDVHGWN